MSKQVQEYVKKTLKLGHKPHHIKAALLTAGHLEHIVEHAFHIVEDEMRCKRKKIQKTGLLLILVVLGILLYTALSSFYPTACEDIVFEQMMVENKSMTCVILSNTSGVQLMIANKGKAIDAYTLAFAGERYNATLFVNSSITNNTLHAKLVDYEYSDLGAIRRLVFTPYAQGIACQRKQVVFPALERCS